MRSVAAVLLCAAAVFGADVVFLEPLQPVDTNRAEVSEEVRTFRRVDPAKYQAWLQSDGAVRALRLYDQAFAILEAAGNPQKQPREYYVALVPGGNHAAVGFRVEGDPADHSRHAYILLAPEASRFDSTLLHETGHVAMAMLADGRQLPRANVAAIPHSTAALSDRGTAFAEGWAIHLETLAAHLASAPAARRMFHREGVVFGEGSYRVSEYFRGASDLTSYAQNYARYVDVRENAFAFGPAFQGPDYLRVQLEKARDYASVRDANQLLQSEGFYASFFFLYLIRGEGRVSEETVTQRHDRMLRAMRALFRKTNMTEDVPWLVLFVQTYAEQYPDEKAAIFDALNDLSHGVFVDPKAAEIWREHYLAALRLDLKGLNLEGIQKIRRGWRERTLADPGVLLSRVGPQIACKSEHPRIQIAAFGEASPLYFDANTAPEGVLRLLNTLAVERWLKERSRAPFTDWMDLQKRVPEAAAFCGPPEI